MTLEMSEFGIAQDALPAMAAKASAFPIWGSPRVPWGHVGQGA
jgi:hypothetical protein